MPFCCREAMFPYSPGVTFLSSRVSTCHVRASHLPFRPACRLRVCFSYFAHSPLFFRNSDHWSFNVVLFCASLPLFVLPPLCLFSCVLLDLRPNSLCDVPHSRLSVACRRGPAVLRRRPQLSTLLLLLPSRAPVRLLLHNCTALF